MSKLYLLCLDKTQLEVDGDVLTIHHGKKDTVIPIQNIQEFRMDEPTRLTRGSIWIKTAKGPDSFLFSSSFAVGLGGELRFIFKAENLEFARAIKKYITEYKAPSSTQPLSGADELRKFKALLDDGIISQEEFDAKKKQILGL